MAILIQETKASREVRYYSIDEARTKWKRGKEDAKTLFIITFILF